MKKILLLSPFVAILFSGCFSLTQKFENKNEDIPQKLIYQTTGTFKSNPIYGPALVNENFKVFMDVDGTKISPDYKNCELETNSKGTLTPFRIHITPTKLTCDSNSGKKVLNVVSGMVVGSDNFEGIEGNIFERSGMTLGNEASDEETKTAFLNLKEKEILVIKGIETNTIKVVLRIEK